VAWAQQLAFSNSFGHSYQRHVSHHKWGSCIQDLVGTPAVGAPFIIVLFSGHSCDWTVLRCLVLHRVVCRALLCFRSYRHSCHRHVSFLCFFIGVASFPLLSACSRSVLKPFGMQSMQPKSSSYQIQSSCGHSCSSSECPPSLAQSRHWSQ